MRTLPIGALVTVLGISIVLSTMPTPLHAQCAGNWLTGQGYPGVDDSVYALAVWDDGHGPALYVGGTFQVAGNVAANGIARWDAAGFSPLGTGVDNDRWVSALANYNGELIVGGNFTMAGGVPVNHIASWNGTNWAPLANGLNGRILALTVFNGDLIAGGEFTAAGDVLVNHIARWDGVSWSAMSEGTDGDVQSLVIYDDQLIAAGAFSHGGGIAAAHIASWDGTNWLPLGEGLEPGPQYGEGFVVRVNTLAVYDGQLIVGGNFTLAGGGEAAGLARWDGSGWSAMGGNWVSPHALAIYDGELFAGTLFGSGGSTGGCISYWNGTVWTPISCGSGGLGIQGGTIYALAIYNHELIVGGNLTRAGDLPVANIARWNGTAWTTLADSMNNHVQALAANNDQLVASGYLATKSGGWGVSCVARWDDTHWSVLDSTFNDTNSLLFFNETLLAAGTLPDEFYSGTVARWDGTSWTPLVSFDKGRVKSLAVFNGELIAGIAGWQLVNIGSRYPWAKPVGSVSRWDGIGWQPLLDRESMSAIEVVAEYHGDLIAGGTFATAGGISARNIARWNGSEWLPLGEGVDGTVRALTIYRDELVVAGDFTAAGAVAAGRIARWNGTSWVDLQMGVNGSVNALAVLGDELFVGGVFQVADGVPASNIARWDGASWSALGQGVNGRVAALAVHRDELVVGGDFTSAGGQVSVYLARWSVADTDGDGVAGACDLCPNDPGKIDPGVCGCGVTDTDADGDGTPDCNDLCPADPAKTDPGVCGCGQLDATGCSAGDTFILRIQAEDNSLQPMRMPAGACVQVTPPEAPENTVFSYWSGDAEGSDNPLTVCMERDKAIIANYQTLSSPTVHNLCGMGGAELLPFACVLTGLVKLRRQKRRDQHTTRAQHGWR